jgi:osmotically-inducible protein OsmY
MKLLTIFLAVATVLSGCSQESKSDYSQAGESLKHAANKTGEGISRDAKDATTNMSKGAEDLKMKSEQALVTGKVKAALMRASDITITNLDVDTVGTTVTLNGVAQDAASKARAEALAKETAGSGYTIANKLSVG